MRGDKLLASLNHPNIAAIYGLEEADEFGTVNQIWQQRKTKSTSSSTGLKNSNAWCLPTSDTSKSFVRIAISMLDFGNYSPHRLTFEREDDNEGNLST